MYTRILRWRDVVITIIGRVVFTVYIWVLLRHVKDWKQALHIHQRAISSRFRTKCTHKQTFKVLYRKLRRAPIGAFEEVLNTLAEPPEVAGAKALNSYSRSNKIMDCWEQRVYSIRDKSKRASELQRILRYLEQMLPARTDKYNMIENRIRRCR